MRSIESFRQSIEGDYYMIVTVTHSRPSYGTVKLSYGHVVEDN